MIKPQKELLQQAERLFWHGKFREALEQLNRLEIQEGMQDTELLKCHLLKSRILVHQNIGKAQDLLTQIIKASQELDQPLIQVDALLILTEALQCIGKLNESMYFMEQGKAVLTTISDVTASDLTEREAMLLALEGGLYTSKLELEHALKCVQQSLTLREQLDNPQTIAHSLFYLGRAYLAKTEYNRAKEFFQQSLTIREQLQHPQEIAQSLYHLGITYTNTGELETALDYLQKSLAIREQLEIPHENAESLSWIGMVYMFKGELDHALELCRKSLTLSEQLGISGTFAEARSFHYIGQISMQKGELEYALENFQKSLALEEKRRYKPQIAWNLCHIGIIKMNQGHLEAAFEYMLKSLKVQEGVETILLAFILFYLVIISLELDNLEAVNHYIHRLEVLQEKMPTTHMDQMSRLARAMLLKASPRTRDKMKAQDLFQQIAEEEVLWVDFTVHASLNLCELLFFEFKTSEDPEILHEIQTVTNRLLDLAKSKYSHSLLAETYVLQSKLALVELDVPRARFLLTQAQAIAEDKGLEKLARSISYEHDILLNQLNEWENLRVHKVPSTKISELAGVEELLTRMVRQRVIEPPELQPEEPLLFMILTESGLSVFTKKFKLGQQLDAHLIGGLLTAIHTFGKDVFAGAETDRITYHGFTVILKALNVLLFCYIFKGQSYFALQKLEKFIERVRSTPGIWKPLNKVMKTDSVFKRVDDIGAKDEIGLNQLITDIFQSRSDKA